MTATASTTAIITKTLEVPGAILTYDIRKNDTTTEPPLLLIGSPMGASGFGTLASQFPDRTVVTYGATTPGRWRPGRVGRVARGRPGCRSR
jgi:hypothetical protein